METSILNSTKKILGLDSDYTVFDLDVLTYINAALSVVSQLGVTEGIFIEDDGPTWDQLLVPEHQKNLIRTYVFLRVRMLFDPPTTSFLIDAMNNQLKEYEWRLSTEREYRLVAPDSDYWLTVDGGTP